MLEQGTVDMLNEAGVGERMPRRAIHHGIDLLFGGKRHRIDLTEKAAGVPSRCMGSTRW